LWAAPVVALTVAAPAVAASGPPSLEVTGSGNGGNRVWTVTFEFLPPNTSIVIRSNQSNKHVRFTGGSGIATPTGFAQVVTVSGATSGSFTFDGQSSPVGTVTADSISKNFS
jgi:hypothetical protein